jgi:hypothetical protein
MGHQVFKTIFLPSPVKDPFNARCRPTTPST